MFWFVWELLLNVWWDVAAWSGRCGHGRQRDQHGVCVHAERSQVQLSASHRHQALADFLACCQEPVHLQGKPHNPFVLDIMGLPLAPFNWQYSHYSISLQSVQTLFWCSKQKIIFLQDIKKSKGIRKKCLSVRLHWKCAKSQGRLTDFTF